MLPFPGGLTDTANGTLLFSIVAAVIFLTMIGRPPTPRRTLAKAVGILLLAFLAFEQGGPLLLIAALVLSAVGDALLAQEGESYFLGGLANFLAAHIAYIVLFAFAGGGAYAFIGELWRILLAVVLLFFAGFMLRRLVPVLDKRLRLPVIAYVAAILLMGLAALTLAEPLVIAGAVLFILSDAVLAWERFLMPVASSMRLPAQRTVWLLYYAAQLLMVLGLLT